MRAAVITITFVLSTAALGARVRVSNQEIRQKAAENSAAMQSCYASYQERELHRFGRIVFDFRILPSGDVSAVQLRQSDLGDAAFFDCVLSNVASWKFTPAKNATQVNGFHFGFNP